MRNGMNVFGALFIAFLVGAPAPESPVADAAMKDDVEAVRSLLRDGADAGAAQGDGMTALHWSALNGNVELIEILVYAGATLEATTRLGGYTPLHLASREGLSDIVRALLEAGSDPGAYTTTGVTAIHFAAEAGQTDAIHALLEHGVDVDSREEYQGRTPLMFATARNNLDAIELLLASGADLTIATEVRDFVEIAKDDGKERARRQRIRQAALDPQPQRERRGQAQAQPGAPQAHADTAAADTAGTKEPSAVPDTAATETPADSLAKKVEEDPNPALAAMPREPDTASAIPDTSPPKPAEPRPLSYTDLVGRQGGMSAMHYAARDGRIEAVSMFLATGADVDQLTLGDHSSPMLVAIINGNYDLAVMLLEAGANPNLVSEDGVGPLFATINNEWALRTWYPQPTASQQQQTTYLELMEALLVAGADPNQRVNTHIWYAAYNAGRMGVDFAGATAFWRAAYGTDVPAMRLLATYGADPNIKTTKPASRRFRRQYPDTTNTRDSSETEEDPSGLEPVPVGGPAVHPLHAASGVGYGTSRVGQQHRHVPDGWLPAVEFLVVELGVDVNVRDHDGYSAVHHAAARGDDETIEFLVAHGADVTFVSRRGQTTVDMANGPQQRVQPFPSTIALLEGYGAINNNNCLSC